MIGILCDNREKDIVQEFFELFKTPWEFYVNDRVYEIIISTKKETPYIKSKVIVVYSSNKISFDSMENIILCSQYANDFVDYEGIELPIYGNILSFKGSGEALIKIVSNGHAAGLKIDGLQGKILRVGYDLFQEVGFLLSVGQPIENAHIPTLDIHIAMLRKWVVGAGVPLVEVPPIPTDYNFIACLTHDVDFIGIHKHKFDHTIWGFIYRASIGSFFNFMKKRLSFTKLLRNWKAVLYLPFVYLGICKDFWFQFNRYLEIERDLKSTFFLVPFKNKAGDKVCISHAERRAIRYDITEIKKLAKNLVAQGYEVGVHGIDAWHSYKKGFQELKRISEITGKSRIGIRMHWLCFDDSSPKILEKAGYNYDTTFGYNATVGCRAGTMQVFRPLGVGRLLELPLHIQDNALFFSKQMYLSEAEAWKRCKKLINQASVYGGALTILWHMRSIAPERQWDDLYIRLLKGLKGRGAWIGTAEQAVEWFRRRRAVSFKEACFTGKELRLVFKNKGNEYNLSLRLRLYKPDCDEGPSRGQTLGYVDVPWTGKNELKISL